MKQTIRHGAQIDAATPDEVAAIFAKRFAQEPIEQYERKKGSIQLDGSGNGQDYVNVPGQYDWILQRITVTGGGGAILSLYENQVANADLLEVIQLGTGGVYSDGFSNNIYVQALSRILIVCVGGAANGLMTYNLQAKILHHRGKS